MELRGFRGNSWLWKNYYSREAVTHREEEFPSKTSSSSLSLRREGIEFWTQAAQAYLQLARQLPGLIKKIDANQSIRTILKDICLELKLRKD